jgi:DNA-binding response OmpR family regulator
LLILVIDESLTMHNIFKASLQRASFTVQTLLDGVQMMSALLERHVPGPLLVVLDAGLPKLDGYSMARAFKHYPGS